MYYSDDVIEEVRMKNDIVDVFEACVDGTLDQINMSDFREKEVPILDYVRFIMKNPLPFRSAHPNRCITALDAEPEEMCLISLWNMKILPLLRQ